MKSLWGQGNKYLRISRKSIDVSPKLAKLLFVMIFILIGIFFVTGNVGLWNLWRAQKEIKGLQAKIDLLEKKNAYLSVEIEGLEKRMLPYYLNHGYLITVKKVLTVMITSSFMYKN